MFENQPPANQNPLNPVMPAPGMTPPPTGTPLPTTPPPAPQVHSMPERFRSAGGGGPSGGSKTTRKLLITLIIVIVAGGLGFGGWYVFTKVLNNSNANNTNLVLINRTNRNSNFNVNSGNVNAANVNAAVNGNANGNSNTNSVVNTNSAGNTNATANTNTAANTNTTTVAGPLPSSTDTDADGLTDVEEAVYGTDPAKADTDGDGFIDGKQVRADGTIVGELYLGYNPKGTGQLEGSGLVKRSEDSLKSYSLLVPTSWTVTTSQDGGLLISPTLQTGEFFQTTINDNPNRLEPKAWYKTNNPNANVDQLTTFAVNGLAGIYSEDQSTAYLFKDTKVYSLTYNTGALTQVNYRTTFDMMIRSFKLVAS